MKYRVGACALLVGLAGCSADDPAAKFGANADGAALQPVNGIALPAQPSRPAKNSIANAPDLGALVSYKNKSVPAKQEGAYTWYPVAVSEAHALKALMTGEMTVPAPDGSRVKLRYERHEEQADGNWTWIGRVEGGDQKQEAILTFGQDAMFGSIPQPNGAPPLSLQTRAGSLFAVVTDRSKVVSPNTRATDALVPPALALRASLAPAVQKAQAQGAVAQAAVAAGAPATSANTIDLAIGYTQGFAAVYGGDSGATTRLVYLLTVGNQAYTNSQINGYLRLVKAVKVDYADNTDNQATLSQLTGHNGTSAVTVPASLVPLRNARNEFGADLAVLVRKFQTPENNGCGIAWLNGAGQTAINPAVDDAFGYAVISDGTDSGTDGKTYFCAEETLVHELGHLMGSAHDRDNSKNSSGGLQYGRYPYSFGMKTTAANGNFYTIMAYGDNLQNFYRTFSSPLVLKCGPANNLACGIAEQADNARSLNQTIPVVAQFRATVVPFGKAASADVNGDGRSDILFRHQVTQQFSHWAMNNNLIQSSAAKAMVGAYSLIGSGDFNGDGIADLLWRNDTSQFVIIWQSGGNGGYTQLEVGGSAGLVFSGIGDFNGDGRSDILWHDVAAGQMHFWAMNGRAATLSAKFGMPGWFKIIGVGDFNNDGLADIAYSNAADVNLYVNSAAGTKFSGKRLANNPTASGWSLLGVADWNGDGTDDFFWRNNASGQMTIWRISSGQSVASTHSYAVSTVLTFAALGDYNGDGRADVLWERVSWRQLSMWTGQGSGGYAGSVVGTYPLGWRVVPDR